jgi:hypothetical protein
VCVNVKNPIELSLGGTSAVKMIDGGTPTIEPTQGRHGRKIIKITVLAHSKHKAFN